MLQNKYIKSYKANENNFKDTFSNKKIISFCIILICLFVVRDIFSKHIPLEVVVSYCFLVIIMCKPSEILAFLCFCIPFSNGMRLTYVVAFGFIVILMYNKFNFNNIKFYFPMTILILLEFAHIFYPPVNLIRILQFVILLFFVNYIFYDNNFQYKKVTIYFIFGAFFTCLLILINTLKINNFNIKELIEKGFRFGLISNGNNSSEILSNNQNMIALYCNLSIAIAINFIYKKIYMVTSILMLIAFSVFGLLTVSRAFILIVLLTLAIVLLTTLKNNFKLMLGFLVTSALVFLIFATCFSEVYQNIIDRFAEEETSGGRLDLLKQYLNFTLSKTSYAIFGVGIQSLDIKCNISNTPHNMLSEVFAAWGLIGLIVVGLYFYAFLRFYLKNKKFSIYDCLPYMVLLVFVQSIQLFSINELIVLIMVVNLFLLTGEQKAEGEKDRWKKQ